MTSRRDVAQYLAAGLGLERTRRVQQAAAWLVASGRTGEASYLARDTASILAGQGYLSGTVTTARPLAATARRPLEDRVASLTGATELELSYQVDPAVLGGVRLDLPDHQLDTTVHAKLQSFVTEMTT